MAMFWMCSSLNSRWARSIWVKMLRASMNRILSSRLGLVEKPQRGRQRDGVEHVRRQRQHGVDQVLLDQRFADVGFGVARIGGGIRHDQRGAALRL